VSCGICRGVEIEAVRSEMEKGQVARLVFGNGFGVEERRQWNVLVAG